MLYQYEKVSKVMNIYRLRIRRHRKFCFIFIPLICTLVLFHYCTPLIARFDPAALELAVSLRKETLNLMEKAVEPYNRHETEIQALMFKIHRAHRYAAARNKNELSARQWEILKNPNQNLVGGFIKLWKDKGRLNTLFITEAVKITAAAFDTIIRLENAKKRG